MAEAVARKPAQLPGFEEVVAEELRQVGRRLVDEHERRQRVVGGGGSAEFAGESAQTTIDSLPPTPTAGMGEQDVRELSHDHPLAVPRADGVTCVAPELPRRPVDDYERGWRLSDVTCGGPSEFLAEAGVQTSESVYRIPGGGLQVDSEAISRKVRVPTWHIQYKQDVCPQTHDHSHSVRRQEGGSDTCIDPSATARSDPLRLSRRGRSRTSPATPRGDFARSFQQVIPLTSSAPSRKTGRSLTLMSLGSLGSMKSNGTMRSSVSKRDLLGVSNAEALDQRMVEELTFTVLPVWEQRVRSAFKTVGTLRSSGLVSPTNQDFEAQSMSTYSLPVTSPNSLPRLLWDILSVACIMHDAVIAPLEFMQAPRTPALTVLNWLARIFWTLDILANFLTGVQLSDGTVELRPRSVALRYLETWLLPDVIIVMADWMEVTLDQAAVASQLIGLLRMLRLVRLLRLQKLVAAAAERAKTERVSLLLSLLGNVGAIFGAAHAMASAWLGLGRNSDKNWVTVAGLPVDEYLDQYILALHWSLTNFAGSMDLQPATTGERFFAVFALMVGFISASWLVSSITSSMTRLSIISSKKTMQFAVLNKYLQEHGISSGLVRRVLLNAKHALEEKEGHMQESSVELLSIVSEPLRAEVHLEIYSPALVCHPLFQRLQRLNPRAMSQICHSGVSLVTLEEGDIAFCRGEVPDNPKMLFVLSGTLEYTRDGQTCIAVSSDQWVSEQVLWMSWVYHGHLQASESCRLLALEARTLQRVCGPGQSGSFEMSKYALKFVQRVNSESEARSEIGNERWCLQIVGDIFEKRRTSSSWILERMTSH